MASVVKISIIVALIGIALYVADIYFTGGVCYSKVRLDGKTVIITGGNTGIGKETAIDLATRGARVIIGCRSKERGEKAVIDIKKQSGNDKVYLKLIDLSSFKSVRAFAKDFLVKEDRLDILINNAGVYRKPTQFELSEDGFETHFQVNHLGHFLLAHLLIDFLKKSAPSRIINVSSLGHKLAVESDLDNVGKRELYNIHHAYAISKLANIVHAKELHRHYSRDNISAFSVHPGVVITDILRHVFRRRPYFEVLMTGLKPVFRVFMKSAKEGAQTTICCAVEEGLERFSGEYFADCAVAKALKLAEDVKFAKKMWDFSMKATKLS